MIWISFAKWSGSSGSVFRLERIYLRGRWTPVITVRVRYPLRSFWRGVWPTRVDEA